MANESSNGSFCLLGISTFSSLAFFLKFHISNNFLFGFRFAQLKSTQKYKTKKKKEKKLLNLRQCYKYT